MPNRNSSTTLEERNTSQALGECLTASGSKSDVNALPIQQFIWGAGIECSFLPHLDVDQFKWTQHNRYWREDFKLAVNELGINHLRYSMPWHTLEPTRGRFDWSYADERVEEAEKLGIDLMLDV